jgi:hypothetical protein
MTTSLVKNDTKSFSISVVLAPRSAVRKFILLKVGRGIRWGNDAMTRGSDRITRPQPQSVEGKIGQTKEESQGEKGGFQNLRAWQL